jgi:HlyD family secretion protein
MSKRLRYALIAAAAVLVAAVGIWRWNAGSKPKPQMETAKVERGKIIAKVTATGTLSALVTVQVGSQVSGRIAELRADFNSTVKKGELIAKIDPQLFQATVEQQRANLVAAQGNLAKARAQAVDARRQADRAKELAAKQLIAQADADTAISNADALVAGAQAAEGQVAQAQAALNSAQVNLAYTSILSPTNGVVISRNVDVGQTVAASLSAPTLFVIAEDLAKMQVDTSVAEADVGRLAGGMDASFTVDAYPSEIFSGKVRQIRNAPQTVQNVVTYDAVIDVDNTAMKLRPGMTANVTFVYAQKDDVLRVPNAALRFRPPPGMVADGGGGRNGGARPEAGGAGGSGGNASGGPVHAKGDGRSEGAEPPDRRTVWTLKDEKPAPARVKTGISDGSFTEVVEGALEVGDVVITDAVGPPSGMAAAMRRGL